MGVALSRSFVRAAFPCILATMAGCGGSAQPPATPTTTAADAARAGSPAPDPSPKGSTSSAAPANDTAKASKTDDGSDIIPPFTAAPTTASGKSGKPGKNGAKGQKQK